MIEIIVVAVLCQALYKQIQCQDAGRGCAFSQEGREGSRFRGKWARGGQAPGPEKPGRLSPGIAVIMSP
jgi:hypothetical protein